MPGGDLKREILLNTIKADTANGTDNSIPVLRRQFPGLTQEECREIVEIIKTALVGDNQDKVSLVVTAPPSFAIDAKPTMTVVQSMLEEAKRNILITGYSLLTRASGVFSSSSSSTMWRSSLMLPS